MFIDLHALHRPVFYPDDPVSHGGQRLVMRDHHHGHPRIPAGILQELQHRLSGVVIQRPRRLVTQEQLGVLRKRSGDGDSLLFSAGKLCREVPDPVPQSHFLKRLRRIQRLL